MTGPTFIRLGAAGAIIVLCSVFRSALESDPVTHVLVQLPALAVAGWIAAATIITLPAVQRLATRYRFEALVVAGFTLAYWMLPRTIDATLINPLVESLKFVSVPCLIGAPLALSWPKLPSLARGFIRANTLSMLGVLAFLYTHAPVRICNAYLQNDQERLGIGFLVVAAVLAFIWGVRPFCAPDHPPGSGAGAAVGNS